MPSRSFRYLPMRRVGRSPGPPRRQRSLRAPDLGCGPGRDLRYLVSLGHRVLGIDGSARFVAVARAYSGCRVLRQNLVNQRLPGQHFDGIFASASLFYILPDDLPRVLSTLRTALNARGSLFALNSRGRDEQGWQGDRFCCDYRLSTWRRTLQVTGFLELAHAYRPLGVPHSQRQWTSAVWRRAD